MTNYNDLTDEQIDIKVTILELRKKYPDAKHIEADPDMSIVWVHTFGHTSYPIIHATSSWSDMGPIILTNRISLSAARDGKWSASTNDTRWKDNLTFDLNPLRAAAIVYLMIKENSK